MLKALGIAQHEVRGAAERRLASGLPAQRCLGYRVTPRLVRNAFKIDLARRAIIRALTQAAAGTLQSQSNKKVC